MNSANMFKVKKIFIILYGLISYSFFILVFIYTIGFLGNFIVPKSIDSGLENGTMESILINGFLLSIFALQHSLMARPAFKKVFERIIDPKIERSTYVLMSSLALILIYWKWQPMKTILWEVENETLAFIITGIFFIGWIIVFLSSFIINHFELFGLKQVFENFKKKQIQNPKFQANYLYKIVRHPMMLGFLIAFWSTPIMSVGHLMFASVTTLYIFIAVKYLEEKDLRKSIGKEYEEYEKKVPMIVPFTKIGK